MGVLDLIFDYFTFEDLERIVLVSKFFWYVATLDKLYKKFEIEAVEFETPAHHPNHISYFLKFIFFW